MAIGLLAKSVAASCGLKKTHAVIGLASGQAIKEGTRILGVDTLSDGTKIWVITEVNRPMTTVILR